MLGTEADVSTHEYRVARRAEQREERASESKWHAMCREAGFAEDEIGGVTIRMLHEKRMTCSKR